MESWRRVWREGVAPQLSDAGLGALRGGLESDDPQLIRGDTTAPPPILAVRDWPCEGGCAIAYPFWKGDGLETVGEVEEKFALVSYEAARLLGEDSAIRYFANWFDGAPWKEVRESLLAEVNLEIERRAASAA